MFLENSDNRTVTHTKTQQYRKPRSETEGLSYTQHSSHKVFHTSRYGHHLTSVTSKEMTYEQMCQVRADGCSNPVVTAAWQADEKFLFLSNFCQRCKKLLGKQNSRMHTIHFRTSQKSYCGGKLANIYWWWIRFYRRGITAAQPVKGRLCIHSQYLEEERELWLLCSFWCMKLRKKYYWTSYQHKTYLMIGQNMNADISYNKMYKNNMEEMIKSWNIELPFYISHFFF